MIRRGPRALALFSLLLLPLFTRCAGSKKAEVAPVTPEQSYERAIGLLEKRDLRKALASLKKIEFGPDTRERLEPLTRIAIADATFYQGNDLALIDARNLYLDFVTLFGDHPLAPYAQLQVGACSLKQVSHPSRDQSQTLQAINDLREVSKRWPGTRWDRASQGMLRKARWNLAESEYLVGTFYLGNKSYKAAIARLLKILDIYPDYADTEKVLFGLGQAYLRSGKTEEGRIYMGRVVIEYPKGEYAKEARKAIAVPEAPEAPPSSSEPAEPSASAGKADGEAVNR